MMNSTVKMFTLFLVTAVIVRVATATSQQLNLPPLPFDPKDMDPFISQDTLSYHHGKHHNKYLQTTASLIPGTPYANMGLDQIVVESYGKNNQIFNNAAQAWNHDFYWKCMTPKGGGGKPPSGILADKMNDSFESFEDFTKQFKDAGNTCFGSGWAWLVYDKKNDKLFVTKTQGADNPMTTPGYFPILCMDVWEHAYYLDYKNERPKYVNIFVEQLINWDFVAMNLDQAIRTSSARHKEL